MNHMVNHMVGENGPHGKFSGLVKYSFSLKTEQGYRCLTSVHREQFCLPKIDKEHVVILGGTVAKYV